MYSPRLTVRPKQHCRFSHQRSGWPFLRANTVLTLSAMETRKMSVVKWAMNLPNSSKPGTPRTTSLDSEISPKSMASDSRSESPQHLTLRQRI
ncbi:unnamed protein product [Lactuca virosa]|uniref:Uncharacterized protein n=1 Tax=Lactuca virosa TaxID=75947 RepID=A0AAU9N3F6_9ASTR|nr:unnamed protein product [Lactuca virosa]